MTIGQIRDGKDMYRALKAHFSLYLVLFKLYMSKFVDDNQEIEKELREAVMNAISDVSGNTKEKNDAVNQKHTSLLETLKNIGFDILTQNTFDASLNKQVRFYRIYMTLFDSILLFIRATREQSWELHLYILHKLCPYFFAFYMINYARMTPCLSLADVRPERKRLENVGHDDLRLFLCIKVGSSIYIDWRRS